MKILVFATALLVSGCGAAYVTPKVKDTLQDGSAVNVVELSRDTIRAANSSSYKPKALPAAFRANAGNGDGLSRGAGALPLPVGREESPRSALEMRLPPETERGPYRIGVGDVLILATTDAGKTVEELAGLLAAQNRRQGYTVQDEGAVSIPDVGRIQVEGMTLEEADAAVFEKLVDSQIDPSFSIEIAEFNSKRVSIGGAVSKPGIVPITLTDLYLDEALTSAGGVAVEDDTYAVVRLYRDGTLYQVPVKELYDNDKLKRIRLMAGDSIFVDSTYSLERASRYFEQQIRLSEVRTAARRDAVTTLNTEVQLRRAALEEERDNFKAREEFGDTDRDYVYIAGEVTTQSRFALPYGRKASLADAIYEDGGIPTRTGNLSQIYVLRASNDLTSLTAYQLDARNAANLILATRMELRPDDVIFVAEQPITRWNRVVDQIGPSLITASAAAATN